MYIFITPPPDPHHPAGTWYVHLAEQGRKQIHSRPKVIFIKKAELIEAQVSPKEKGLTMGSQALSRAGVQWGRGVGLSGGPHVSSQELPVQSENAP